MFVIGFFPFLGTILTSVLQPVLFGGLCLAAHNAKNGTAPAIGDLFLALKNPAIRTPTLILGAISLGVSLVTSLIMGGSIFGGVALMQSASPTMIGAGVGVMGLLGLMVYAAGVAALMYAVPLVVISRIEPIEAIKLSFLGTIKNAVPLLIFGVLEVIILVLGAMVFMVGLIIALPIASLAHYSSFAEIFDSTK
jgi:uncharacterized membrane protein